MIILYVISALIIVSLGVWIASAYPVKLSMVAPFFDKTTHDSIQKWTIIYGCSIALALSKMPWNRDVNPQCKLP